jgi:PAS domain S-box-containing protein
MQIGGYQIVEWMGRTSGSSLCRARRMADGAPALLKLLEAGASRSELGRFRREYELLEQLRAAVAHPLALVSEGSLAAIVLDGVGGDLLESALGAPLPIARALHLGQRLAEALVALHEAHQVHRDLRPVNVLVTHGTDRVCLVDLSRASPPAATATSTQTDLAYISPEQTGRTRYPIDVRADLYSLGVVLYRMISGRLPFTARDPLEWVHCHLARTPTSLADLVPGLPRVVADVVMRLLAKAPDARYQSAHGVAADLARCLASWESRRCIGPFALGARDIADVVAIPAALYGRDRERAALHAAYDRVAATARTELVLVAGPAGTGKSSLVHALREHVARRGGFFLAGKFDQGRRDIPYATFAQAFRSLRQHILGGSESQVDDWRRRLRDALGRGGPVIAAAIPELAVLLGPQPPAPEVGPREAENRFHAAFRQLLAVVARREHPVVLFVDDLQWLDPASRRLLEVVATHADDRHLLVVGSYRDDEVSVAHPLAATLDALRAAGAPVSTIEVGPMTPAHLATLIGDALHCSPARAAPLAELVHAKTGGNPFFATQFLLALHDEGLISLDRGTGVFRWDVAKIRAKNVSDNVVALMLAKLRRFPVATQTALADLAFLGNSAETTVLAMVRGAPAAEIQAALAEAVRAGLIHATTSGYRFLHDRVQEASYALVPESRRADTHLRIARCLTEGLPADALAQHLFEVVGQWNRAIERVSDGGERTALAWRNASAGKKAKAATAYALARTYFAHALELLPPDAWTERYEATLDLYLELAEREFFAGAHQRADELLDVAQSRARSAVDGARVRRLRIRLYQLASRPRDAIAVLVDALRAMHVVVPETADEMRTAAAGELGRLTQLLRRRGVADLVDAPLATDPAVRVVIDLLDEGRPAAYVARSPLWPFIAAKGAVLSLEHGSVASSPGSYLGCALALSAAGETELAIELADAALLLHDRLGAAAAAHTGKLLATYAGMFNVWRRHYAASLPLLDRAFAACLEGGDLLYAGYISYNAVWLLLESGAALELVADAAARYAAFNRETGNSLMGEVVAREEELVARLRGLAGVAVPTARDEARLARLAAAGFEIGVALCHVMDQIEAYLEGRYADAWRSAAAAAPLMPAARSLAIEASHHVFRGLTAAALHAGAAADQRSELASVVRDEVERLGRWQQIGAETFAARHRLLVAELSRIEARWGDAERDYEQAITAAREHAFVQYEAMAWEAAARFYRERGLAMTADLYLREARGCYQRWGAGAAVSRLGRDPASAGASRSPDAPLEALDRLAVIKASQAISRQIRLDELIETLMHVVLESAGAQIAGLLLIRGGRLALAARASLDGVSVLHRDERELVPSELPLSVLHYVRRSKEHVLLADAGKASPFGSDPYLVERRPRSLLCVPIVRQAELVGVLYVENTLMIDAFPPDRLEMLTLLAGQAAISLENAWLYEDLERENRERRQAQAALKDNQALLQAIVDTLPTFIYVKDLEGRFLLANRRLADVLGVDRASVVGRTDYDFFSTEQADAYRAVDQRVLAEGLPMEAEELAPEADGVRTYLSIKAPLLDASGRPYGLCGVSTDITARKRAEVALRHTEDQLRQAQKMEAIGNLAGGVAHDFNNLLSVILSYSVMLAEDMGPGDPRYGDLREIEAAGRRAEELTRQLLAFSRKQILQPRLVDLNAIVAGMERMLRRLIGEDIELAVVLGAPLHAARLDPGQVEQIIMNLVVNARDAMPAGGKLTIETASVVLDERYAADHVGAVAAPHVMLAVSDTGTGMDEVTRAHIFEPFFTTKALGKGTGLGLATVFGIVQQSGGTIDVHSEPGRGTTFEIYFPQAEPAAAEPVDRAPPAQVSRAGAATILLVEDDERVRGLARTILARAGYEVLEAASGDDAIAIGERYPATIHLLLTDVVMPRMSGPELASRMRGARPTMRVLYMSGYTDGAIVHYGVLAPGVAFLQKPVTPEGLARSVHDVLAG